MTWTSWVSLCNVSDVSCTICLLMKKTAPTKSYTLSLHDALPISPSARATTRPNRSPGAIRVAETRAALHESVRSEEHTSELQSQFHFVCRLLLEKKKRAI